MIRLALALALLLVAGPASALEPFQSAGIDRRIAATVPLDRPFRDETGERATLRELGRGRPMLLVPVQHRCPNFCGLTLAGLVQAIRALPPDAGRDFAIVAFGIDRREGPAEAAASLHDLRRAFPSVAFNGIHALTGEQADIAAVASAIGYRFAWDEELAQFAHVAAIAIVAGDGRLSRWLYGLSPDPAALALGLAEAAEGRAASWGEQLLLLCYRYDPRTGRLGAMVWTMLRIAGAATAAGLAVAVAIALRRERGARDQPNPRVE